jgi:hypothetical protein
MSTSSAEIDLGAFEAVAPSYVELVFAIVFVWGFGDAVSTLLALSFTGQISMEANPFVRALMAHEPLLVLVMKGIVALVVGVTLLRYREFVESVPLWRTWLVGVLGLGTAIVVTNLYVGVAALA